MVVLMKDLGLSPAICERPLVAASLKACAYTGFLLLLSGPRGPPAPYGRRPTGCG